MSKTVRVGFIGAGGIAQAHMKSLQLAEDVQLVGIYDIAPGKAAEAAAIYGGIPFSDPYELIDTKQIDAVFVCTPPFARSDYETTAAQKGVHLFAEKPPGLNLPEVEAKLEIIQRSGIITSSGHSSRYAPVIDKAKELLGDRQVDLIHLYRYHGLPKQPWLSIMATSGGQMVDQTIHDVDVVRYLVGDYKDVYARMAQRSLKQVNPDADIYDVGAVTFTLATGAIGSVTTTNLLAGYSRREIMLIGNGFTIIADRKTSAVTFYDGQQVQTFDCKGANYQAIQDRAFIEAVRAGKQELVRCSYEEAYKTLKVVLAMNESALSGQPVHID
ncbi:MAG: oxidoreductase [Paenibacillus sp.]|nr:oxidoreductase [Paenibacillus sp.]